MLALIITRDPRWSKLMEVGFKVDDVIYSGDLSGPPLVFMQRIGNEAFLPDDLEFICFEIDSESADVISEKSIGELSIMGHSVFCDGKRHYISSVDYEDFGKKTLEFFDKHNVLQSFVDRNEMSEMCYAMIERKRSKDMMRLGFKVIEHDDGVTTVSAKYLGSPVPNIDAIVALMGDSIPFFVQDTHGMVAYRSAKKTKIHAMGDDASVDKRMLESVAKKLHVEHFMDSLLTCSIHEHINHMNQASKSHQTSYDDIKMHISSLEVFDELALLADVKDNDRVAIIVAPKDADAEMSSMGFKSTSCNMAGVPLHPDDCLVYVKKLVPIDDESLRLSLPKIPLWGMLDISKAPIQGGHAIASDGEEIRSLKMMSPVSLDESAAFDAIATLALAKMNLIGSPLLEILGFTAV